MTEFANIQMTDAIERAFLEDGITTPSRIQEAATEPILSGRHVLLESGTGTGKTLAYLLPILQRLHSEPKGRTVIVAPSAELVVQILGIARRYKEESVALVGVMAGGNHKLAKDKLQKSTRLIVGTPGRILELYQQRKLKGVTTMVLDEPDPILVGDNAGYLREIMSRPEPKLQVIIVGATMGPKTESLVDDILGDDVARVSVDDDPLRTRIEHYFVRVAREDKEVSLARFLENNKCSRAIVFVSQRQRIRHVYRYLSEHRHKPVTVSDERAKQERRAALDAFNSGKARVLITTDIAARGLDVPRVDWVLHYDLPQSAPAYVHRAGRTGRAGREGLSISFVNDDEAPALRRFARELDIECSAFPRE